MTPRHKWRPLKRAVCKPISEALINDLLATGKYESRDKIIAELEHEEKTTTVWLNDLYQVQRPALDRGWWRRRRHNP